MHHIFYNDFVYWGKAPEHARIKSELLPAIEARLPDTKEQNNWVCKVNTEFFSKHEGMEKYTDLVVSSIYPVLDKFFEELTFLNVPKQSKVVEIWYNYYSPGNYQEVHAHTSRMDISGIYLLKLDETNKTSFYSYATTNTKLSHPVKHVTEAEEGDVILFPSHLSHYVLPCEKTRVSVAFNIRCEF